MTDSGSQPSDEPLRWARLTGKQRACLDLLLERQTSKQIARHLQISKQAVDLRITTARHILGAANRDEAALIYARLRQTYETDIALRNRLRRQKLPADLAQRQVE